MGLVRRVNIFVYQIDDRHFGAGFIRRVCEKKGKIVEIWPVNTKKQIDYVKRNGSKHGDAYERVQKLAERAEQMLQEEPDDYDELLEGLLIDLSSKPFWERVATALKLILGRY